MLVDFVPHPGRLAAQVGVVGAIGDARRNKFVAIKLVRPDRGQHYLGPLAHRVERGWIGGIGHHQSRIGRRTDQITHFLELGEAPTRHRPFWRAVAGGQIFGHQAPGIPRCAVDNDIEFAVVRHFHSLTSA